MGHRRWLAAAVTVGVSSCGGGPNHPSFLQDVDEVDGAVGHAVAGHTGDGSSTDRGPVLDAPAEHLVDASTTGATADSNATLDASADAASNEGARMDAVATSDGEEQDVVTSGDGADAVSMGDAALADAEPTDGPTPDAAPSDAASTTDGARESSLPVITFNEGLSTVLRGIALNSTVATALGVDPGYYHLREDRNGVQYAIALELQAKWWGCPNSPRSDQRWVFYQFTTSTYDATGIVYDVKDGFGNRLELSVSFPEVSGMCFTVNYARLNGNDVYFSTQSYATYEFNSCNPPEPTPFADPPCSP